jgi:hypothetical protein
LTPREWTAWKIRCIDVAEIIDAHRIFPKVFVFGYGILCWHIALWYMGLEVPGNEQTAFVTIVVSVFAPLFNWYSQGGRRWQ